MAPLDQSAIRDIPVPVKPTVKGIGAAVETIALDLDFVKEVMHDHYEVTINGLVGDIYIAPSESESSELIWSDNSSGVIFNVSAPVIKDVLIRIAENIMTE